MQECRNCLNLAAEMTATRAIVERLERTLLGNGQPGRCAEHAARISRMERWRAWVTGALAVLGILWMAAVTVVTAAVVERMKH
jgi:hypothetical protein